jgi:hypothetical protein
VRSITPFTLAVLLAALSVPASADLVVINPIKDNTLYESSSGSLSNGAGTAMFAGTTFQPTGSLRRAVMAFDVAGAIPQGSVITNAQLTLRMTQTIDVTPRDMSLFGLEEDWGEGTSVAQGGQGSGAPSAPGDATWIHTFFDTMFWNAPGGAFAAAPSATTLVGGTGFYDWTGPGIIADAQSWLDTPTANFGWILIGDEDSQPTARKFETRETQNPDDRPQLLLVFEQTTPVSGSTWGRIKALLGNEAE